MVIIKEANGIWLIPDETDIEFALEQIEAETPSEYILHNLFHMDIFSIGNNSGFSFHCEDSSLHQFCGALTSSPLISEELELDDYGEIVGVKEVYWFPDYQVTDPLEMLLKDRVFFSKATNIGEK